MESFLNTAILKNPLNWVTVWLMAAFLAFLIHFFVAWEKDMHPGGSVQSSNAGLGSAAAPAVD